MSAVVNRLREMKLPVADLVEVVISESEFQTNEVFDYLWSMNMSEVTLYKLVYKSFFINTETHFEKEHVINKLMTLKFPASQIVYLIKQTTLGLSAKMLQLLEKNLPSGAEMVWLLYDSPQFLTEETLELFKRRVRTQHEVITILDNARGLTAWQRESLVELCLEFANEQQKQFLLS